MLTKAQCTIIRQICSIQFKSLTDILITIDLGTDEEGDHYDDIFEDLGISRKEFDVELIQTIHNFQAVIRNPEKVFELEELDMSVFVFILNNFQHHWRDTYPKALQNLRNKIFLITMSPKIEQNEQA